MIFVFQMYDYNYYNQNKIYYLNFWILYVVQSYFYYYAQIRIACFWVWISEFEFMNLNLNLFFFKMIDSKVMESPGALFELFRELKGNPSSSDTKKGSVIISSSHENKITKFQYLAIGGWEVNVQESNNVYLLSVQSV